MDSIRNLAILAEILPPDPKVGDIYYGMNIDSVLEVIGLTKGVFGEPIVECKVSSISTGRLKRLSESYFLDRFRDLMMAEIIYKRPQS